MTDQLQDFIRREHLSFEMEFIFKLMIVNTCVTGCQDQHTAIRCFERKCFCNSGAFHTEGGGGQIHSGRGYGKLLNTVLQTECTKICSSFCYRHDFDYSCFRLVKIRKNGQANNSGILTPLTEAS